MIELIIAEYLNKHLDVPASMEVPEGLKRYVRIEKTGGGYVSEGVYKATVAIQSIAETLYEAALLNERVKEVMNGIEELNAVSSCTYNTDYNHTNTKTKTYRYQVVYDIVHY